jgi:carbamoyltransferase
MNILGISAFYHDSAACLVQDGLIISAAQEERFTRKKHDQSFPINAIKWCLKYSQLKGSDIDCVAFYDKPFLKFERLLETYLAYAPQGLKSFNKAMPLWIKQKMWIKELIQKEIPGFKAEIYFPQHHESHASSAFFASPFKEAAFLTMDGVGEWATASYGVGKDNKIDLLGELRFPHSLGLLYSAFTYYLGFRVNSGEYKLMGLAPYGEAKYKDLILSNLLDLKDDGSFKLRMEYFNYCAGLTMTTKKFHDLFKMPPRKKESVLTQKHMDIARSIQAVTEIIMLKMAEHVYKKTKMTRLCLAGGVALNCVGNGRILREGPFSEVWIQPAAGDAGAAVGAALFCWYQLLDNKRVTDEKNDAMSYSYLGPEFKDSEIEAFLKKNDITYKKLTTSEIPEVIADLIAKENVIGWFQGRMEFGPRALGHRSILGDARSSKMQKKINLKIKFRESFRPFAPSILESKVSDCLELKGKSPYMLLTAAINDNLRLKLSPEEESACGLKKLEVVRSQLPAITHVDYSARVQSISESANPLFYKLLENFGRKHKYPVIINTSFNVRGEPIVLSPQDAYNCFIQTDMDYLLMGSYLLNKEDQKQIKSKKAEHKEKDHTFELIEDIKKIEATSKNIKKFALALSVVILVFNGFLYAFKGYIYFWMLLLALVLSVSALIKPNILKYIYKAWTTIALIIAWIINTIILSIVFYVVVTPIALIARIAKKEFLEIKIDNKTKSYWHDLKESNKDIAAYKGQF